jgi:hypothetical protein
VLRLVSYNNTAGAAGVTQKKILFSASDGTISSNPVTATVNISVASGQVLGNRLFYNNSRYDGHLPAGSLGGDAAINSFDDDAIAPDKIGYSGTGGASFANISSFSKGITGVMIDVAAGPGTHNLISKTSGDLSFVVAPSTFSAGSYNQLSTWTAAPAPTSVVVRMGAGVGGSDRIEITWAASVAVKNNWLGVRLKAGADSGLTNDDVFYFGSVVGDSGAGDPTGQAKTESTDGSLAVSSILAATTPIYEALDYDKNGAVDAADVSTASGNNGTLIRYLGAVTGTFAPAGAPAALVVGPPTGGTNAASAVVSALTAPSGGLRATTPPASNVVTAPQTAVRAAAVSFFHQLGSSDAVGKLDKTIGAVETCLGLDDDLLKALASRLEG